MSNNIYGFISTYDNSFVETGLTERGAKMEATKEGSQRVGYRSWINNMYIETSIKKDGKWSK